MNPLRLFAGKLDRPYRGPDRPCALTLVFRADLDETPGNENPQRRRRETETLEIQFGSDVDDVALGLERLAARLRTLNGEREVRAPIDVLKSLQHHLSSICTASTQLFDGPAVEGVVQEIGDYLKGQGY